MYLVIQYQQKNISEDLKSAMVSAIHKKGSRQEPGNYRPINLTSVVYNTT